MSNTIKTSFAHGFTLIELMITMAIIGILAAIAIPSYNGYIKTAKMSEAHNNLAALRLAEEEYFLENNEYFDGNGWSAVQTASGGLWMRSKGSGDTYNFDYVVTLSSGWTATATGLGETIKAEK
ncbi:MAG: prepilin-type N-terminal cleavage/methylation domain-containing protein [Gammaproteobacteria bacterium]|nr:prepilin-type N-terminal cleavage/methylation domain-containing protein [Gammaproteobacteria bacterium]